MIFWTWKDHKREIHYVRISLWRFLFPEFTPQPTKPTSPTTDFVFLLVSVSFSRFLISWKVLISPLSGRWTTAHCKTGEVVWCRAVPYHCTFSSSYCSDVLFSRPLWQSFSNLPICPMATKLTSYPWLTFNPLCPGRQNKAADITSSSLPAPLPLPPLYALVGWWSEQKPRAAMGNRDITQKAQLQALFHTLQPQSEEDLFLSMKSTQASSGPHSVSIFLLSFL